MSHPFAQQQSLQMLHHHNHHHQGSHPNHNPMNMGGNSRAGNGPTQGPLATHIPTAGVGNNQMQAPMTMPAKVHHHQQHPSHHGGPPSHHMPQGMGNPMGMHMAHHQFNSQHTHGPHTHPSHQQQPQHRVHHHPAPHQQGPAAPQSSAQQSMPSAHHHQHDMPNNGHLAASSMQHQSNARNVVGHVPEHNHQMLQGSMTQHHYHSGPSPIHQNHCTTGSMPMERGDVSSRQMHPNLGTQAHVTAAAPSIAAETAAPPPEGGVTPHEVATAFAFQYYRMLSVRVNEVHKFYIQDSQMTRGSTVLQTWDFSRVAGMSKIDETLRNATQGLNMALLHAVEGQQSVNGAILVLIMGVLHFDDGRERSFSHTAFLAPQNDHNQPCFFVLNDIFVYNEGTPHRAGPPTGGDQPAATTGLASIIGEDQRLPGVAAQSQTAPVTAKVQTESTTTLVHEPAATTPAPSFTPAGPPLTVNNPVVPPQPTADQPILSRTQVVATPAEVPDQPSVEDRLTEIAVEEKVHTTAVVETSQLVEPVATSPVAQAVDQAVDWDAVTPASKVESTAVQPTDISPAVEPIAVETPKVVAAAPTEITKPAPALPATPATSSAWGKPRSSAETKAKTEEPSLTDSVVAAEKEKSALTHQDVKQSQQQQQQQHSSVAQQRPIAAEYSATSYAGKLLRRPSSGGETKMGYVQINTHEPAAPASAGEEGSEQAGKSLFVANIPAEATDAHIRKAIKEALKGEATEGHVVSVSPLRNRNAAFVELDTEMCAEELLRNGLHLCGQKVFVERANHKRKKESRPNNNERPIGGTPRRVNDSTAGFTSGGPRRTNDSAATSSWRERGATGMANIEQENVRTAPRNEWSTGHPQRTGDRSGGPRGPKRAAGGQHRTNDYRGGGEQNTIPTIPAAVTDDGWIDASRRRERPRNIQRPPTMTA